MTNEEVQVYQERFNKIKEVSKEIEKLQLDKSDSNKRFTKQIESLSKKLHLLIHSDPNQTEMDLEASKEEPIDGSGEKSEVLLTDKEADELIFDLIDRVSEYYGKAISDKWVVTYDEDNYVFLVKRAIKRNGKIVLDEGTTSYTAEGLKQLADAIHEYARGEE